MFKLENIKKLNTALLGLGVSALVATSLNAGNGVSIDGAVKYPTENGKYSDYYVNDQKIKYNNGRPATKNEIAAWNIDVKPNGEGLPEYDMHQGKPVLDEDGKPKKAEGSVSMGEELYDTQCVMCHGEFGGGGKGYPMLAGGSVASLKIQRLNPADENPNPETPVRTIGSYWPYASTIFWYVYDSMPFPHPKSLTNSETYAITAYLLSVNNIKIDGETLDDEYVLDREKFMKIQMPNKDGFYPDVESPNPKEGLEKMRALLSDPTIYGKGTRCMSNCIEKQFGKGKTVDDVLLKIKIPLDDGIVQPVSTERTWKEPEVAGAVMPGQVEYEAKCSACHGNAAIGAPVVGDKEAWAEVTKKGLDAVYSNALNGVNAMPPKGGHMDSSDDEIKMIVDYMINASK